ncbi:MAG: hypothetical protein LBC82_06390 [Oscillospiraceae bacterium]|jgi:hypothetical protein|nr:hypothetical protein [Oscillospiraceae bacterium]
MIDYFAGKYFVQEGLLKSEKLMEIMTRQNVINANFSKLEKDASSFLVENQVMLIKLMQHTIDEKLGDLAFEYGGVDEEKFKFTVRKQEVLNTAFFDQLIVEGIITPDMVAPMLEKMRNYYALNSPGVSRNLKHDFDVILGTHVDTGERYANEYMNIALKYILRFVGTNIKLGKANAVRSYFARRAAIQKVVTDPRRYFLGICGEKTILQNFNDGLENSFANNRKDARYSALCAFLDCISNVFQCLIMTEKNVLLVDHSNVYKFATIASDRQIFVMPLMVRDMSVEIIAGFGDKPNFAVLSHNL